MKKPGEYFDYFKQLSPGVQGVVAFSSALVLLVIGFNPAVGAGIIGFLVGLQSLLKG